MKKKLKQTFLKIVQKFSSHKFGVSRFEYDDTQINLKVWGTGPNLLAYKVVLSNTNKNLVEQFIYPRPDLWKKHNKKKPKDYYKETRFSELKSNFDFNEKTYFSLHIMLGKRCVFKQRLKPKLVDKIKLDQGPVINKNLHDIEKPVVDSSILQLFNLGAPNSVIETANTDLNVYITDLLAVCASLAEENEQLRAKLNQQ